MSKKYLYCLKCKNFPDKVVEEYHLIEELRIWNEKMGCYELNESSLENPDNIRCAECDTDLEEK